MKKKA
jgi:hypothetical protein